jgi:hypothetical protein
VAIRARIDPVEVTTVAKIEAELSLPDQRRAAAALARHGIEDAKEKNRQILGRVPRYVNMVDGQRGAPLESVNPAGGQIITEFELAVDVMHWIADALLAASPEVSGEYKRGHTLFADGIEVPLGGTIHDAQEYVFTNQVPYARKIEIGTTKSGRAFVIQVPNRIYERTANVAKQRFGNILKISFTYRGIVGGRTGSGRRFNRSGARSPAIVLRHLG